MKEIPLCDFQRENDGETWAAALEYARQHPGTTLRAAARVYYLSTPLARATRERVLSGELGENPEQAMFSPDFAFDRGLSLLGHRGTKILASGAVLLIDGFMEPVSLRDSEDILLEGLTIDHVRRPFSRGEVVAAREGEIVVRFGPEYPVTASTPMPRLCLYNVPEKRLAYDEYGFTGRRYEGGGVFRFAGRGLDAFMKGWPLYAWHTFHYRPGILIEGCRRVCLRDVTIHSQPGMGIVGHRSEDLLLTRLRVVPAPGEHMSTNTDATHFTSCKGMLRIEDSEFEGHGDDATNVHTYYHSLIPTGERRCRLRLDSPTWTHSQTLDYPDPGDRLELVSRDSLRTRRTYRVVTAEPDFAARETSVTLDGPLPEHPERYYLADVTRLPRLEFVRCRASSHLARSVLIKTREALVEDCTFTNVVGTAIEVAAESPWKEGVTSSEVVIRGNHIRDCARTPGTRIRGAGGICVTVDAPEPRGALHGQVVIEGNSIDCPAAEHGICVTHALRTVIRGNTVHCREEPVVVEECGKRQAD